MIDPPASPSMQLAAMIRAQVRAQVPARGIAGRSVTRGTPASQRDAGSAPNSAGEAEIQELVLQRVRALAPDDPQGPRKAARLFMESVLRHALGGQYAHAGFDRLVDTVLARMEADAGLRAALHQAGEQLLADAGQDPAQDADPMPG